MGGEDRAKGAPDAEAIARMREHVEGTHGHPFDLSLDVDYPGQRRETGPITYLPAEGGSLARYTCQLCPGRNFPLGDPYSYAHPLKQLRWLRRHPEMAAKIRRKVPEQLWGRFIEAYESAEVGDGGIEGWLRKRLQRVSRKGRPQDVRREEGCQRQLLRLRLQGQTVEETIENLLAMQSDDPEQWREVTGGTRRVGESTLERYWGRIPLAVRAEAELIANGKDEGRDPAIEQRLLRLVNP